MKRKVLVIILTAIIWSSALSACGMDTTINPTKAAEMTEFTEEALTADPTGRDKGTEKQSEGEGQTETAKQEMRSAEASWAGWNLDQYLEVTDNVFLGTCTDIKDTASGRLILSFQVQKNIKGVIDQEVEEFWTLPEIDYKTGQQYLVFCGRESSVFRDKDIYGISVVVFEKDGKLIHEGIFNLEQSDLNEVVQYVEAYAASHPEEEDKEIPRSYIDSDDLDEIYDFSSCVMTVEITGVVDDTQADRTIYSFSPIEVLKGEIKNEDWIVTFKDSMEEGGQYLVFLSAGGEYSRLFISSAKKSVFDIHSDEAKRFLQG